MTTDRKPQAAIYVRLSSYREDDPSVSPQTQRRACENWCETNGYEVAAVYEDLDVSGGSLARPQLDKLRSEWRRYDAMVASKIDRLSRSVRDFDTINREAQAAGVSLVAVRDNLDMSTAIGRFIATIIAAFAEMELAVISDRLRSGKATARALGRWLGGPVPFGFTTEKLRAGGVGLVVDPAEAEILRQAAEHKLDGMSWHELVRWLETVARPKRSEYWSVRTVRAMLTREQLRGAVFTPAEFEAVHKACAPMERSQWTTNRSRLLSGLLRCGVCGHKLAVQPRGNGHYGYRCVRAQCLGVNISAEKLDAYVEQEFLAVIGGQTDLRMRTVADVNDEAAAELELELRTLNAGLPDMGDDEAVTAIQRRRELHAELDRLRAMPRGHVVAVSTGRTKRETFEASDMDGRRRLIQENTDGVIHIGPAKKRGARKFDPERVTPFPLFEVE